MTMVEMMGWRTPCAACRRGGSACAGHYPTTAQWPRRSAAPHAHPRHRPATASLSRPRARARGTGGLVFKGGGADRAESLERRRCGLRAARGATSHIVCVFSLCQKGSLSMALCRASFSCIWGRQGSCVRFECAAQRRVQELRLDVDGRNQVLGGGHADQPLNLLHDLLRLLHLALFAQLFSFGLQFLDLNRRVQRIPPRRY